MSKKDSQKQSDMTRRGFLRASGTVAAVAGGAMAGCGAAQPALETAPDDSAPSPEETQPAASAAPLIKRFRTLGRTGFEVSDISMGCGRISDANVVRYAYDNGVNLFDVAEGYGNGDSERKIGEAMAHMDREKIFIVTKLKIEKEEKEQSILDRFDKCLERLKTNYVDALYTHAVTDVSMVKHAAFHSAAEKLKAQGKLKHTGISSHGPHDGTGNSMEEVLLAAVEDGRFDVMLLVYNFMKTEEGERILAACKEKNIGTTGMKTYAGRLKVDAFDPDNPSEEYAGYLKILADRGMTREQSIEYIQKRLKSNMEELEKFKPAMDAFIAKHGIKTQDALDKESIKWVLGNSDMHTICVSMPDFDKAEQRIPLSGTELSASGARLLEEYKLAFGSQYCRHGCKECLPLCPHGVSVSTVMRYAYYFNCQGREKHAIEKYAVLGNRDASPCLDCDAPCLAGCPYGVQVRSSLLKAHGMLTLA